MARYSFLRRVDKRIRTVENPTSTTMPRRDPPGVRIPGGGHRCADCLSRAAGIFSDLDGEKLLRLEGARISRSLKKGETLYSEGDQLRSFYCVRSGRVKLFKTTGRGDSFILRIAGPGEVLGLESLVAQQRATAGARMLEDGVVCATDRKVLLDLVRGDPRTACRVIATLATRLRESDEDRLALARLTVRERTARLFLLFAQSHGSPARNDFRLPAGLTRQGLAEIVGAAPETLMRLLRDFREEGILDAGRREVTILDRRRLLQAAHLLGQP